MWDERSLSNYYRSNFILSFRHKYSIQDLDNIYPFEKDIYIQLLNEQVEKDNNPQV